MDTSEMTTASARLPRLILERAEALGLHHVELMRLAGLDESEVQEPDGRVDLEKIRHLWWTILERLPDPALGIRFGAASEVRELGVVGYSMVHSATVRDALHRLCRFGGLLFDGMNYRLEARDGHSRLVVESDRPIKERRRTIDARLASALAWVREIAGEGVEPTKVHFSYARPEDISFHASFFRTVMLFGQRRAALIFEDEALDRPLPGKDKTLCGFLDRLAEQMLRSLEGPESFSERARRAIAELLSAERPTVKKVAEHLGVSARTLQRRLEEEGKSFTAILESVRRDAALQMLKGGNMRIYEVASRLGYSESSTFHRAFRRWEHKSPRRYRRAQRQRATAPTENVG